MTKPVTNNSTRAAPPHPPAAPVSVDPAGPNRATQSVNQTAHGSPVCAACRIRPPWGSSGRDVRLVCSFNRDVPGSCTATTTAAITAALPISSGAVWRHQHGLFVLRVPVRASRQNFLCAFSFSLDMARLLPSPHLGAADVHVIFILWRDIYMYVLHVVSWSMPGPGNPAGARPLAVII